MFLLGAAFAAELFLVVCMASRSASPRQVMYTFKDDVWDVIYRLNRRWNLWKSTWLFGGWTDKLSIFFCILGLCKRDKNFAAVSQNNKISHKELRLLLHCVTISREGE